jgi:hypothetical protein
VNKTVCYLKIKDEIQFIETRGVRSIHYKTIRKRASFVLWLLFKEQV